tara:strand:- start:1045 stop:1323 length:279 start_codon:yes stop_codon:yes gene_type:complete
MNRKEQYKSIANEFKKWLKGWKVELHGGSHDFVYIENKNGFKTVITISTGLTREERKIAFTNRRIFGYLAKVPRASYATDKNIKRFAEFLKS